jgi:hypothetical protein
MTNKQLLALAANAHGGLIYVTDTDHYYPNPRKFSDDPWDPLDDDGDAFRLAVKLKICIEFYSHGVDVWRGSERDCRPYNDDAGKATRLAIVAVAAEIGKAIAAKHPAA